MKNSGYELCRLRLFSFGGYGLALAALALVIFGAIECPPSILTTAYAFKNNLAAFTVCFTMKRVPRGSCTLQLARQIIVSCDIKWEPRQRVESK